MPRPTELLDLYAVDPSRREVDWVDGFAGLMAAVQYLTANPDDRCHVLTDVAGGIRAVAFFSAGNLLLLTSGGATAP